MGTLSPMAVVDTRTPAMSGRLLKGDRYSVTIVSTK
jgi:hypothetical protein